MISPNTTIPIVDPITATNPDESASMKMVRVELTSTLPSSKLRFKTAQNIAISILYITTISSLLKVMPTNALIVIL